MEDLGILYFVRNFPKLSKSFILNEIYELSKRGHNVAVFAQVNPRENVTHEEYDSLDIPIRYFDVEYSDIPRALSRKPIKMGVNSIRNGFFSYLRPTQIGKSLILGKECSDFIEELEFEIDIIHAHFATPERIGAIHTAGYHDIPATVTAHAYEIFREPNVRRVRWICDSMDHVVVPSEYNHRYLREEIGVQNEMTVVPATTRIDKFEPTAETVDNRLLTVGRLVEKKGYPISIEAISDLVNDGYEIEYHIIGSGEMEERLRNQLQEFDIEEYVKFLGNVSDERLTLELSEASIFVLACVIAEDGDRDAMPVVLKEAMASETACVSTTVSAIPELITDGYDGILVEPNDSEELAIAIRDMLDDPDERRRLAENGRETVQEKFDISRSVDTLLDVFETCIDQTKYG